MSPPENKKKTQSPTPTLQWNSLPDDLLLSCFAHVSRSYYLTLSLVSKRFRSLIASPELYKARLLLGYTESCLYVCINLFSVGEIMWFTLYGNPHKTPSRKESESNEYFLAKVPMAHSPSVDYRGLVAVGSSIYSICGSSSDSVFVLDCATHTWSEAPSFRVKLATFTTSVVDKKIYVAGCSKHDDPTSSIIEVLDTETQIWDALSIPWRQIRSNFTYKSTCINGKFNLQMHSWYGKDDAAAYSSEEHRWDLVEPVSMHYSLCSDGFCVIENVLYAVYGFVAWYDTKANTWRSLKGLEGLPNFREYGHVRLADYGGKMAVLWVEDFHYRGKFREKRIWCAEIALERRENCEMWGKVEWFGHVLSVPNLCSIVRLVAVTV